MPKSILLLNPPTLRGPRQPHRHVHFDELLDWRKEEWKSIRGHALRNRQRSRRRWYRRISFERHFDRKRAFDVLSSTNTAIQTLVQDLLDEDGRTTDKLYSYCLYTMLQALGAPSFNFKVMLEWFRHSGIQYSKQLSREYEFNEDYLLFLGRAPVFTKRFEEHTDQAWTNPFLTIIPTGAYPNESKEVSSYVRTTAATVSSPPPPTTGSGIYLPDDMDDEVPFGGSSSTSKSTPQHHGPEVVLLRALKYLWWTLTRRRTVLNLDSSEAVNHGCFPWVWNSQDLKSTDSVATGTLSHWTDDTNDPWNTDWITGSNPCVSYSRIRLRVVDS